MTFEWLPLVSNWKHLGTCVEKPSTVHSTEIGTRSCKHINGRCNKVGAPNTIGEAASLPNSHMDYRPFQQGRVKRFLQATPGFAQHCESVESVESAAFPVLARDQDDRGHVCVFKAGMFRTSSFLNLQILDVAMIKPAVGAFSRGAAQQQPPPPPKILDFRACRNHHKSAYSNIHV